MRGSSFTEPQLTEERSRDLRSILGCHPQRDSRSTRCLHDLSHYLSKPVVEVARRDRERRAMLVEKLLARGFHQQFSASQFSHRERMRVHGILLEVHSLLGASAAIPP